MQNQKLQFLLSKSHGYLKNRSAFIFRQCTPKDADEANKMVLWFLTTSVVTESMKLKPEDAKDVSKYYLDSCFLNSLSFGVFEKSNGKLAGLGLFKMENYGSQVNMEKVPEPYRERIRLQLAAADGIITEKSPELGKYGCVQLCNVYPEYARSGMASEINAVGMDIAKFHGCREFGGSLSSSFILKLCLHSGYQVTGKIKLSDYVDPVNGTKPFTDAQPPNDFFYWVNKPLYPDESEM